MRVAVIGIGSNSVRMLLADVASTEGRRIRRERSGTRLFAGLDEQKRLTEDSMAATAQAVAEMAASARKSGAEELHLFATSATRDAANGADFTRRLQAQLGVEPRICSGEEEACLSFLGATDGGDCGVIDIGGGSTEVVMGEGEQLRTLFSCQMGAVRLYRLYPLNSAADIPTVKAAAADILAAKLAEAGEVRLPPVWRGTGGTFTTLAAMVKGIPWTERTYMHGTVLPYERIAQEAALLADMPMAQRLQLPGLQPARADIVVHGICILLSCMERFGIEQMTVSERGNLEGYLQRAYGLKKWV